MAAVTASVFVVFSSFFVFVSAEQKNITAESGQNVTLTCRAVLDYDIGVVMWIRADLGSEHVLVYPNRRLDPKFYHPSFKNWVDLQDRQMKDGDVSLILKDATVNDTGTYECWVFMTGTGSGNTISTIYLVVVGPPGQPGGTTEDGGEEDGGKEDGGKEDGGKEDGGKEDGSVGLIVGLSVSALLLLVAAVGFLIYRIISRSSVLLFHCSLSETSQSLLQSPKCSHQVLKSGSQRESYNLFGSQK